jgi:hypothetical protein
MPKKKTDTFRLKPSAITVYSTAWCPDCKRAKKFFGEHRVQYNTVDIEEYPEGVSFVERLNNGMRIMPKNLAYRPRQNVNFMM